MKEVLKTRILSIERRVNDVSLTVQIAFDYIPGIYRLVFVLCKGELGVLWRWVLCRLDNDDVVHGLLLTDRYLC